MLLLVILAATNFLGWAATVAVPMMVLVIPLAWAALTRKLNNVDNRNTDQHASAAELRTERFEALEARLDQVLEITTETNKVVREAHTKLDEHLRDHLIGAI